MCVNCRGQTGGIPRDFCKRSLSLWCCVGVAAACTQRAASEPGPARCGASRHQTASPPRLASPDPIRACVHLPWIGAITVEDRPLSDTMLLFWTFALIGRAAWSTRAVPPSAVHSDPLSWKPEQRRLTECVPRVAATRQAASRRLPRSRPQSCQRSPAAPTVLDGGSYSV